VPVAQIANTTNVFVVSPASGIKTFKDLVDRARTAPNAVSYGSSGSGSLQNIAGESLSRQANVKLLHVPYKGVAPALVDVVGGRLTVMFSDASGIPYVKSGQLTALAVSPKAIDELPNVPSVADAAAAAGLPGYVPPAIWYGIVVVVEQRTHSSTQLSLAVLTLIEMLRGSGNSGSECGQRRKCNNRHFHVLLLQWRERGRARGVP